MSSGDQASIDGEITKSCSLCDRDHYARGMCSTHYVAAWRKENRERLAPLEAEYRARTKDRHLAVCAAWRAANKERHLDSAVRWRKANPERFLAICKKARAKRRVQNSAYQSARDREFPEIANARNAKRRAAKLRATPAWANQFFISEAYHLAKVRSKTTGFKWHVDHIVPLQSERVCGLHCEANLQVIPAALNRSKKNCHWPDMPT